MSDPASTPAVAIPLPGGQILRAGIHASPDGELSELVLSLAPRHRALDAKTELLVLPIEALAGLRAALETLTVPSRAGARRGRMPNRTARGGARGTQL